MKLLSIHEVAGRTGLTPHTLRYYERIGLISPVGRGIGGQRRYAEADIAWVEFLVRLRATRMPIARMKEFAILRSAGDVTYPYRRLMLETHLAELQQVMDDMQRAATTISEKIAFYKESERVSVARPND
ncbi:MerR family transcriptional regulator [Stutzerimonas kirkiae]|uniref:MerR family transcriptional regulator n=1 Tax=Stutzerimonas kirkiae TaxID=2211392 RepID=A0A4Q9RE12_9GAMM|nr:MerR family transcriptional regulator [Stutzerimonas kirkiae]TBU99810.1 MerR family transcriptional regulator [Stutzerimonas kirkiae]TBV05258.1 MerR family transcriptional regulator [Stutzerimonas kirkiae]TBV11692.1 MerR family transcriptional regulator [Stutzerimonas kirkiae]TBV15379.1 MerR family transcriptional regulator [Stutzerimonas kirkiae]